MTVFYSLESRSVNSSLVHTALWGYLGRQTDAKNETGESYQQGLCVGLNGGKDYFYPASRDEFDTLVNNSGMSAGQYYNTFLKGREGAERVDEVMPASDTLRSIAEWSSAPVQKRTTSGNNSVEHNLGTHPTVADVPVTIPGADFKYSNKREIVVRVDHDALSWALEMLTNCDLIDYVDRIERV